MAISEKESCFREDDLNKRTICAEKVLHDLWWDNTHLHLSTYLWHVEAYCTYKPCLTLILWNGRVQ